jgi:hypothetical protein
VGCARGARGERAVTKRQDRRDRERTVVALGTSGANAGHYPYEARRLESEGSWRKPAGCAGQSEAKGDAVAAARIRLLKQLGRTRGAAGWIDSAGSAEMLSALGGLWKRRGLSCARRVLSEKRWKRHPS